MPDGVQTEDFSVTETQTGSMEFQGSVETPDPMARSKVPAPEGVPEKFWDGEKGEMRTDALLKSYAELEKQFREREQGEEPGAEAEESEGDDAEVQTEAAEEAGDEAGSEDQDEGEASEAEEASPMAEAVEKAQAHYAEHGELSEEVIEDLVGVGYTRQQIDLYMAGVKAQEAALYQVAEEAAGSMEEYEKAKLWAAENWTEKQIATFDGQINDLDTARMAASALMADYRKANPGEGRMVETVTGMTRGDVYSSMEEYDADLTAAGTSREKRRAAVEKYRRSLKAKTIKPVRAQPFGR